MTLRRWLPLFLIVTGAILGFLLLRDRLGFEILRDNRLALLAFRDAHPVLTPALFIAVYVVFVAFSLPGAVWITLTGGFLFGLFPGVVYNVGAATLGALILFLAVRTGPGEGLRARIDASDGAVRRLSDGIRANEVPVLLSMRLIPAVPFFVANLLPALVGVKFRTYFWTTALGILPGALVFTSIGVGVGEVFDRGETPDLSLLRAPAVLWPLLGLCALALLPILVRSARGRREF